MKLIAKPTNHMYIGAYEDPWIENLKSCKRWPTRRGFAS